MKANLKADDLIREMENTMQVRPGTLTMYTRRGEIPQWDSLGHVVLVEAISRRFNVALSADETLEMETVSDVLRILQNKLN